MKFIEKHRNLADSSAVEEAVLLASVELAVHSLNSEVLHASLQIVLVCYSPGLIQWMAGTGRK
jgi:hypothetical protein